MQPDPWGPTIVPPTAEPLLAGLWRHRHAILARWPHLPLPTHRPAQTRPIYVPLPDAERRGDVPTSSSAPAGPGPDIDAGALITVWHHWPYAHGTCQLCRGPMVAVFWGGILGVGGVTGICVECFTRGARFLPGICTALFPIQRLLAGTGLSFEWTPLAFRLGGTAPALRDVLVSLGEQQLPDDRLVPYDGVH